MINLVIDLSDKLDGFNLYESFLYDAENQGKLFFLNNPLDCQTFNLDEIINNAAIKLSEKQENTWNLTLILGMEKQAEDPYTNSVANRLKTIKDAISARLSKQYRLQKTFVILIDDVERNNEGLIENKNVKKAIQFDKKGYIFNDSGYLMDKAFFTKNDFESIDQFWTNIINSKYAIDNSMIQDKKGLFDEIVNEVNSNYIDSKINILNANSNVEYANWYKSVLEEIKSDFAKEVETNINSNTNNIYNIAKPSECLKRYLYNYASGVGNEQVSVFKFDYHNINQGSYYNNRYSNLLKIVSFILFISNNDDCMKKIINANSYNSEPADYKVNMNIQQDKLNDMISSYYYALNREYDMVTAKKINKIDILQYNKPELTFNDINSDDKRVKLPVIDKFYNSNDINIIRKFEKDIFNRYSKAIDKTKNRMRDLSTTLKVEQDKSEKNITKSISVSEAEEIIKEFNNHIDSLEQEVALNKPSFTYEDTSKVKRKYNVLANKAIETSYEKPSLKEILLICASIFTSMLLCCPLLDHFMKFNFIKYISVILAAIIMAFACLFIVFLTTGDKQKETEGILRKMQKDNNEAIKKLFEEDKSFVIYVKNIFEIMMRRKYVEMIENQIAYSSKTDANSGKHAQWLNDHKQTCEILKTKLNITSTSFNDLATKRELNVSLDYDKQSFYCPIAYANDTMSEIAVGTEVKYTEECKSIPYINQINFVVEKEYEYE